jgi:predicted RNase H-like HicB family nuclease
MMSRATKPKGKRKQRIKKVVAKYTVLIERDEETGQYCVSVPALPGCFTYGDTIEEAIANAQECIQGFVMTLQKLGKPVPIPIEVTLPLRWE